MWQIYIAFWFITGGFTGSLFYAVQFDARLTTSPELDFSGINCIKIGALLGLLFGLMFTLLISSMRKSQIFWTRADEVEALIKLAETKEGLQSIYENEFQDLRKKCQGGPQILELNRLYTIMKTKYKYVPQNK